MPPPLPEEKSEDAAALLGPVHIVQIRHPTFGGCAKYTMKIRRDCKNALVRQHRELPRSDSIFV